MNVRLVAVVALTAAAGMAGCAGDAGSGEELAELELVAYEDPSVGAIQVLSTAPDPRDWFEVYQGGTRAYSGNPPLLGGTVEVAPGTYEVDVNRTRRTVTVPAGRKAVLRTGDLIVEGEPAGAYWYPMQDGARTLTGNPSTLNSFRALFAGSYQVFVHESVTMPEQDLGYAEVRPGRTSVLRR